MRKWRRQDRQRGVRRNAWQRMTDAVRPQSGWRKGVGVCAKPGKQEAKIVPDASVEKRQKKAVRLVSAERHQKKNVCSAPAETRQRKAVLSVRAELWQTEAAQSGNARQWQKADAQNGNVPFQQKKAARSAITRRHRRIVRRKSLQHRENAGMRARRFRCVRHPARSFTTRWIGRNTVIAQRDMSRNQSDPDAPARQKPG